MEQFLDFTFQTFQVQQIEDVTKDHVHAYLKKNVKNSVIQLLIAI
nr:hypothetical protein [Allocoprobacillus halotolerans]